jgi:predicted dehydrogenase
MSIIKVAVIGYGHLGKWHCQKVDALPEAELYAIVEPFESNAQIAKQNHPNAKIVKDIKEIINDIDAGVIVTPTSTHFELTKYLLQNKKHVFCEKPLCSTYQEVEDLIPFLNKDKVLQVGHSERCHQAWELLKEELTAIGSHCSIELNRVAAFKGRATDVDVVQDLMIHDLDLLLYLFPNKLPNKLKAIGHKVRTGKWDHATCILEYADGSYASITSGRNHVKEVRDLEIMHDGGCIYVDLFRNSYALATSSQYADGSFVKEQTYEKRDHLLIEHQSFYKAILGKSNPMVTFKDGQKAVYLIDRVIESLNTKKSIDLKF